MSSLHTLQKYAYELGQHPQDHGWRGLYRLLAEALRNRAPALTTVVSDHFATHPHGSHSHFITLLGIAIKEVAAEAFHDLITGTAAGPRTAQLDRLLAKHQRTIQNILSTRRNSFTGARRFLVPQVLLSAYFGRVGIPARFADLGTGLGIMPRQLNSQTLYQDFSQDLRWPEGIPTFRRIPLAARFGVDQGPMPDLAWVSACYGGSAYYAALRDELRYALAISEKNAQQVTYRALDITDSDSLITFITDNQINAVNLCYTLYEMEPSCRESIIQNLLASLRSPKVIVITEPSGELTRPGCTVTLHHDRSTTPLRVCRVSDGHFKGVVGPLEDFERFQADYPISYRTAVAQPTEVA